MPSGLLSVGKLIWLSVAGAPLFPQVAVITAVAYFALGTLAVTVSAVGLRLI